MTIIALLLLVAGIVVANILLFYQPSTTTDTSVLGNIKQDTAKPKNDVKVYKTVTDNYIRPFKYLNGGFKEPDCGAANLCGEARYPVMAPQVTY